MVWIRSHGLVRYVAKNTRLRLSEINMTKEKMDYETAYKELKKEIEGLTKPKTLSDRLKKIKDISNLTTDYLLIDNPKKQSIPFYYFIVTICSFIVFISIILAIITSIVISVIVTKGWIIILSILFSVVYLWVKSGSTD